MGFTLTSPAVQSVRRSRQDLVVGTGPSGSFLAKILLFLSRFNEQS